MLRRARRGLSLIEVMIAMTLLALIATSHTALTLRFGQRQQAVGLGVYRSATLVQYVNKYMAMPWDSLTAHTGCTTVATSASNPFGYERCVAVSDLSSTQRAVVIVVTPSSTLLKPDTVVLRRAKAVTAPPLGT